MKTRVISTNGTSGIRERAAAHNRGGPANLGEGAQVGSVHFSREERFRAATLAFDGGASRFRQFLDAANERSNEDVEHIEATNFPYAEDK